MTPEQKTELLEQSKAHLAADILLKGTYGENGDGFKGCSVGCHLHHIYPELKPDDVGELDDKHQKVADHYGYPVWLVYLQDAIFEGLPNGPQGECSQWHVQLAEVLHKLPDDYDWQAALHRVHAAILRVSLNTAGEAKESVERVLDLHERASAGEDVSDEMWSAARSAARSAAKSAEWSAEWSAWSAWSAARSAAKSAESAEWSVAKSAESAARSAAESAAWSAERSAAESAEWSAAYQEIRDAALAALEGS